MRKVVIGLIGVSVLALPAQAQQRGKKPPAAATTKQQRDDTDLDQKYRAALQHTRSDVAVTPRKDPWADVRGVSGGKP